MSYKINFTDTIANPNGITVADQSLNTQTNLTFVGKNYSGDFLTPMGENFLHLLENFASTSAPATSKAVVGQLWYDANPTNPQLKVLDGSKKWVAAGGIIKSSIRPEEANIGDLWSDSVNQQLYLWTGTQWLLVGPQFNQANSTGLKVEEIRDRESNLNKIVMTMFIENKRIAIFSKEQFIPKSTILGFGSIKQGITLSAEDFDQSGINKNKFWGVSEKSESLVVGPNTVAASNFLRSDVASTTNNTFNIRSSSGLNLGSSLETSITSSIVGTVIHQKTPGSVIVLKTTEAGTNLFNDVVTITGDKKVGINKNPIATLDVEGNISSTGILRISDTTDSSTINIASAVFSGGVSIAKKLNVGDDLIVAGKVRVGSTIEPATTNVLNLGSSVKKFNTLYSTKFGDESSPGTFTGTFNGQFFGNVSGTASQLASDTDFSITGDVNTNLSVPFNGTQNDVVLNTSINPLFVNNKTAVTDINDTDVFLVYQQGATELNKVTRSVLLKGIGVVPVGSIMPFAGSVVPPGYLLCDGSEQSRSIYAQLYSVIGFSYRSQSLLRGFQTFALPDLRGRFPLGKENMDNGTTVNIEISATNVSRDIVLVNAITARFVVSNTNIINGPFQIGRTVTGTGLNIGLGAAVITSVALLQGNVTTEVIVSVPPQPAQLPETTGLVLSSVGIIDAGGGNPNPSRVSSAIAEGIVGGQAAHTLTTNQIPEHQHDLKDSVGNQYFAVRNATGSVPEPNVTEGNLYFESSAGHFLKNTGGVDTTGSLGESFNIINPYQTINYIIFTGRIVG
jgi:microcystin-dependent protein